MSQAHQPASNVQNDHGVLIDPTANDFGRIERSVRQMLQALAIANESDLASPQDVDVRDLIPSEDLDSGGDNGWTTASRQWEQTGLTADQFNETYVIDAQSGSGGNAEGKYVAIIAVSNLSPSPATTEAQFNTGTGALFEDLQLQGLLTDDETTGLLADPIINKNGQRTPIEQYVTATSDELVFHGAVAEPAGTTLEKGIDRFLSDQQAGL